MNWLLLAAAVSLSSVAAFYSVTGLMAIFSAAPVSIAIMGSVLEFSKLVVASWLWRNWDQTRLALKTYLTAAVVVLIMLTSLGTYGYLSAAHATATGTAATAAANLQLIDTRLAEQEAILRQNTAVIGQLDTALNEIISRSTSASTVQRALAIRQSQAAERREIAKSSAAASAVIASLQVERQTAATAMRAVETKAGPLQYIASLFGSGSQTSLDTAIRLLILLIVAVFDPLAVLMFIAYNQSVTRANRESATTVAHHTEPVTQQIQPVLQTTEPVTQQIQPVLQTPEPDQPDDLEKPATLDTQPQNPTTQPEWERDRKLEPLP